MRRAHRLWQVWDSKAARRWPRSRATPTGFQGHADRVVWSAAFSPDGARIVTASWDNTARVWDAEWLVNTRGVVLVRRACEEKLVPGTKLFTAEDAADPILFCLEGTNPCERVGPLSLRYWTRLIGLN